MGFPFSVGMAARGGAISHTRQATFESDLGQRRIQDSDDGSMAPAERAATAGLIGGLSAAVAAGVLRLEDFFGAV
jgi:hypothetical protein